MNRPMTHQQVLTIIADAHRQGMAPRLSGANLEGADLSDALLQYADMQGAHLVNADFQRANVRHANVSDADLRGVQLQAAQLGHVILMHTDLRGADLRDANLGIKGIDRVDLNTTRRSQGADARWLACLRTFGTAARRSNAVDMQVAKEPHV